MDIFQQKKKQEKLTSEQKERFTAGQYGNEYPLPVPPHPRADVRDKMKKPMPFEIIERERIVMVCTEDEPCSHHNIKCKWPNCTRGWEVKRLEHEMRSKKERK